MTRIQLRNLTTVRDLGNAQLGQTAGGFLGGLIAALFTQSLPFKKKKCLRLPLLQAVCRPVF